MNINEGLGYKFAREENGNLRRSKRLLHGGNNGRLDGHGIETLPRAKTRQKTSRRKTKPKPRKNRPYQDYNNMSLQCCTEKTCLLNLGRGVIGLMRREFDQKLYEAQNNYLNSLVEVQPRTARNRISYNIRDVSGLRKIVVCRRAFLKMFGIGRKKIAVLLRKKKPFSGDIEEDQRRFSRNGKRLPLALKAEVN